MKRVTIVGAGVSGLTCAVRLLESGYRVTIRTRETPSETTSGVAAALWFPFRAYPLDKVLDWSLSSLKRFSELESNPGSGIRTTTVREVYRSAPPSAGWRERLAGFRRLRDTELPEAFSGGFAIDVPVIDSSRYLPFLVQSIDGLGGRIVMGDVEDLADVGVGADLIVNCSGTGARVLAKDESVYPIRGQIVRVPSTGFHDATVDEGSVEATYIVPRFDDCVLGTTIEDNEWDRNPSQDSSRRIMSRCAQLDPRIADVEILEARVGLRPGRPEIRLELERRSAQPPVIHNYGHGGSGFTLSWGCADDVLTLVDAELAPDR